MEKRALGKGLGALIPGTDELLTKSAVSEIQISKISLNPYQPRIGIDDEKFQELVNSVRVHGILQPILVRVKSNGNYELVAGERRLRAATVAGLPSIPAVVREFSNEQSLEAALIENIQREDISPFDSAKAYKRLSDEFGLSQEEISFALGKSRSSIANTIRLLNLPEVILNYLKNGQLSEGHCRAILSVINENDQISLADLIVKDGLSVREAEKMAKEITSEQEHTEINIVSRETITKEIDPNILDFQSRLRERFGTKVNIVKKNNKGKIELEFFSDEEFERILNLLAGF